MYDTAVPPPGALLVGLIGGYYMRHYGKNIDSGALDRQDIVCGRLDGAAHSIFRALHSGARVHCISRSDWYRDR